MKYISILAFLIISLLLTGIPKAISGRAEGLTSQGFVQSAKIFASDRSPYARFGSVVVFSDDDQIMLVGAPLQPVAGQDNQGQVYIFRRNANDTWTEVQRIVAPDGAANDEFGSSIAIADAPYYTIIVGAASDDTSPHTDLGAAYVFAYNGSSWSHQRKLPVVDANQFSYDHRGRAVAISANGATAFVGAPGVSGAGGSSPGAVYVFSRSGSTWSQTQKIEGPIGGAAGIGRGMALSDDGTILLVGGVYSPAGPVIGHGIVRIYQKLGGFWKEIVSLFPSDGVQFDEFGTAIAASDDAKSLLIGAPNNQTGRAYIFTKNGAAWTEKAILTRPSGSIYGSFGTAVALDSNGTKAAIGAWLNGSGAVHRLEGSGGTWRFLQVLTTPDDRQEHLGFAVAMTNDTQLIAGGARSAHSSGKVFDQVGAVYLFKPGTGTNLYLPVIIK